MVETQRNVPAIGHHIGYDEGVMIYSTCGFSLRLYENTPAERQPKCYVYSGDLQVCRALSSSGGAPL